MAEKRLILFVQDAVLIDFDAILRVERSVPDPRSEKEAVVVYLKDKGGQVWLNQISFEDVVEQLTKVGAA